MTAPPSSHWSIRTGGVSAALLTLVLMLATEPWLAIVWDEGYTMGREARIRMWIRALRDPARFAAAWEPPVIELVQQVGPQPPRRDQVDSRAELFAPEVIAWFWPFAREEPHGHPPFYAIVGLAGDLLTPWRPALERARLGPMLLFSLTAGAIWSFVARRYGAWAGTLAAGAWVLQPNLFANGHYATVDAILSSLWVLSLFAFEAAVTPRESEPSRRPRWGWVAVFGLVAGCAAATKLTGWFLPLPFLAWSVLRRDSRGFLTLLGGGVVGVLTLYACNPGWWFAPIEGVLRFLQSNLTRAQTIPIPVLFLGRVIQTPGQSLPWYNTLVWTVFVTPFGFLVFALVGAARALWRFRSEPASALALLHWAFLLLLRALPHTPGHDGVRQFLPAFGVLSVLAGIGGAAAVERLGRLGKSLVSTAMVEGVLAVALMMPVPLSYFSPVVGGLPGATRLGMEPTYFWDALSDEALDWLNANTPEGGSVRFATGPTSWFYLRDVGRLRPELAIDPRRPYTWYVLQNRPGERALRYWDRALVARGKPSFVVEKWGVPLVWIFSGRELESALRSQ